MELRKRMHQPCAEVGKWLRSVVAGHNRYYGVPSNLRSLSSFRFHVGRSLVSHAAATQPEDAAYVGADVPFD